jgi:hypothetical protein
VVSRIFIGEGSPHRKDALDGAVLEQLLEVRAGGRQVLQAAAAVLLHQRRVGVGPHRRDHQLLGGWGGSGAVHSEWRSAGF